MFIDILKCKDIFTIVKGLTFIGASTVPCATVSLAWGQNHTQENATFPAHKSINHIISDDPNANNNEKSSRTHKHITSVLY